MQAMSNARTWALQHPRCPSRTSRDWWSEQHKGPSCSDVDERRWIFQRRTDLSIAHSLDCSVGGGTPHFPVDSPRVPCSVGDWWAKRGRAWRARTWPRRGVWRVWRGCHEPRVVEVIRQPRRRDVDHSIRGLPSTRIPAVTASTMIQTKRRGEERV